MVRRRKSFHNNINIPLLRWWLYLNTFRITEGRGKTSTFINHTICIAPVGIERETN